MLHPLDSNSNAAKKNAGSCVLHIVGAFHSALLPGDIGKSEEKTLALSNHALKADVVIVAHHGSSSSSSEHFVRQVQARHAIAQLGYLNRFKHPDPQVVERWQSVNSTFWRTDLQGAINVYSAAHGLDVYSLRNAQHRYWHN
jgi:competence protein ComEC